MVRAFIKKSQQTPDKALKVARSSIASRINCSMPKPGLGLTQDAIAERMGTTKNAISRLEASGKHTPSLATLQRHARAVDCDHQAERLPQK